MICPSCNREVEPSLFCHVCDVYMGNPAAGTKAGVARRFAAQILDGVAVWVIFFLVLALAGIVAGASQSAGLTLTTAFWAFIGYVVFAFWFLSQGKTPGKWMVGIRVVDKRQGFNPGLGRMLVRETIGKFVSGLFFGLGYFWAIFDREAQAWHDKIAGTVVVRQGADLAVLAPAAAHRSVPAAAGMIPTPLVAPPARPPSSDHAAHFCSGCGARLEPGSRFCENCGARV
jgi:uncharacterized RDD family membrane protein YckC